MLWWMWSIKKVMFIKNDVLQFESVPRRNPLSLLFVAWVWRMKDDLNTTEIVDFS